MQKLKSYEVEDRLLSLGKRVFTTRDLVVIFGANRRTAGAFISYNVKKGVFIRLKNGVFTLKRDFPGDFYLANNLYYPSYVSLETALSYYGLIPEAIYSIISVTPKPTREFDIQGRAFIYHKIKKSAYASFVTKKIGKDFVYLATPEKAVLDFLYFVFLGKKNFNDRLELRKIEREKVNRHLKLFKNSEFSLFLDKIWPRK